MSPLYLAEIGRIPLLTLEEEAELSRRVQAGCREARNRMIAANLRLVVRIAGEFAQSGLPMAELVSEGNVGLIKAVEKFRPQKGSKFSSYASWWIRQAMSVAVGEQRGAMNLSPTAMRKLSKLRSAANGMAETLGREPTDAELAEELGLDAGAVQRLRNVAARPASMEALIGEEGGATLGSMLTDHAAEDPRDTLGHKDVASEARQLLVFLDEKERLVVIRRYGLDGTPAATLAAVGAELGCTRERVRQIQEEALKRMRQAFARRQVTRFLEVMDGSPSPVAPRSVSELPAVCAA
jgi:RNA polymerase primary sigma factor